MPVEQDDAAGLARIQGTQAGATIQLGADFLTYARKRYGAVEFKNALVERLLPTVPRGGRPRKVRGGDVFGKFEIQGRLGKGGMAEVYLAVDPERRQGKKSADKRGERGDHVAIKVMKPSIAHDPSYVSRFLREAANTALIEHPNVVRVFEVGAVDGRLYFTMELIEGETLKEHLQKRPLSEEHGVQVLCQLVDGLVAAHERDIGHRDLKPANVMLVTNEARYGIDLKDAYDVHVKITDFGLAHQLDADRSDNMPGGRFLGTAKYVAPEVIKGEQATLKSDVFSLGVLAFQMFAGQAPFPAKNKLEYLSANLQMEAPALDDLAEVTPELAGVVDRMLAKDPALRPDGGALRRDLGRLAGRTEPGEAISTDDPTSVFARARPSADEGGKPPPVKALVAVGALALVLVVVGLLVALPDGDDGPEPAPTDSASPDPTGTRSPVTPPPPVTPTPAGDPLLAPVRASEAAFGDALARHEFVESLEAGDAAWRADDPAAALERWQTAAGLMTTALPEPLRERVRAGRRAVALAASAAAEERGDYRTAWTELESAVQAGAAGAELEARRERLRTRVQREDAFDARMVEARRLARREADRDEAIARFGELLPVAVELGRADEVKAALERLGVEVAEEPSPTPTSAPPADDPPEGEEPVAEGPSDVDRTRADVLLQRAEELFRQGAVSAAAEAVEQAVASAGPDARSRALARRLALARATPDGWRYVEPAPDGAGAIYVRLDPVTNAEFHAWYREASQREPLLPPKPWRGRDRPPADQADEPVRGVQLEQAEAYAAWADARLPRADERPLVAAETGAPAAVAEDGVLDGPFHVVRDAEAP